MIHIINCKKIFNGNIIKTIALNETTITINDGEFISIVGPSGSGKSTLLSLIGALDMPSSGKIMFDNQDITKLKGDELADFRFQHIGFVFQQYNLIPTLSVLENVMSPLFSRKVNYNKEIRAKELLNQVGLKEKESSLPFQLSGGEQQRVAIARALVNEPSWLLADEPTGNLDSKNSDVIFKLLKELNREKKCGVLLVTHDLKLAEQADRIIELKDGYVL